MIVQGLEERVVKTKEQVLKIMEEGSLKRTTAATKMNASSSRSHTIFTITVRLIKMAFKHPMDQTRIDPTPTCMLISLFT